jgi:hypothetical protein
MLYDGGCGGADRALSAGPSREIALLHRRGGSLVRLNDAAAVHPGGGFPHQCAPERLGRTPTAKVGRERFSAPTLLPLARATRITTGACWRRQPAFSRHNGGQEEGYNSGMVRGSDGVEYFWRGHSRNASNFGIWMRSIVYFPGRRPPFSKAPAKAHSSLAL